MAAIGFARSAALWRLAGEGQASEQEGREMEMVVCVRQTIDRDGDEVSAVRNSTGIIQPEIQEGSLSIRYTTVIFYLYHGGNISPQVSNISHLIGEPPILKFPLYSATPCARVLQHDAMNG